MTSFVKYPKKKMCPKKYSGMHPRVTLIHIQCNEAESASPRPENKYSGVPEAYSGLVTFKYASGTPEYIYISYQHFGHEQKSIYPQILWFSIQR